MNNLAGKKLEVVFITRSDMFDCDIPGCCDNCGRAIVNVATVRDEFGKEYTIGLDCKKTLIDKPKIAEIMASGDWAAEYKAKEYKKEAGHVHRFLELSARKDVDVEITNSDVTITDREPHKNFPELTGNIIYLENTGYLVRLGLGDYLKRLHSRVIARV